MMNRPIPIYLICVWFFIYFATLPQRYTDFVTSIIGVENFKMFSIAFIIGIFIISFKFFKCEKAFVNVVIVFFGSYTIFVLASVFWKMIHNWDKLAFSSTVGSMFIAVNILSVIYLVLPSNRIQIAKTRTTINAEIDRKFQLKQLYKK